MDFNQNKQDSAVASGVGQTGNMSRTSSGGAAKVFREFKWGLLTLFLLMVVVIGLVYDGGKKKKPVAEADLPPRTDPVIALDPLTEVGEPPVAVNPLPPPTNPIPAPGPGGPRTNLGDGIRSAPPIPQPQPIQPIVQPSPVIEVPSPTPAPVPMPMPLPRETVGTSPVPPEAPKAAAETKTYIVKPGDTLSTIAQTLLPGRGGMKAILEANKDVLANPDRLRVGMELKIPMTLPAAETPRTREVAAPPEKATPKEAAKDAAAAEGTYVVRSGDTLEGIARKLFNDGRKWREIYEWNRNQLADPGRLRAGQVLRIKPVADSGATTPNALDQSQPAQLPAVETGLATAPKESDELPVMSSTSPANLP